MNPTIAPRLAAGARDFFAGWSGLILGPIFLAVLLLALIWSLVMSRIEEDEKLAIQNALANNKNIAHVAAENLSQVLERMTLYTKLAADYVGGERKALAYLNPTLLGDRAYVRLAIFDRNSQLLHTSSRAKAEPGFANLIEQAGKRWSDSAAIPSIVVGHPPEDASEAWRIPLLLRFSAQNDFQGYLAAYLDLGYFLRLYQGVNLGTGARIEIIDENGFQLAESNGVTLSVNRGINSAAYFQKARTGSDVFARPGEGTLAAFALEKAKNYPMTVAVSRDRDEILKDIAPNRQRYVWWALAVSAGVLLTMFSMTALAYRQRRIHHALTVTEREKQRLIEQLENEKNNAYHIASHDHLTGLPNRLLFAEMSASHLSRARRSRKHYATLFVDLDRFKTINDSLGHRVGDLLLQTVASRLLGCLREADVIARFGGDEFVALVTEVESVGDVAAIAAKMVETVGEPCRNLDGHDLEVRPSIGIALYPQDGQDIETLLKHADTAMYEAKRAGRGTFRFFDQALNSKAGLHLELEHGMRRALENQEFCIHYQPQVGLSDFRLSGLEALIRWNHPKHGLIFPGEFIPLAEENGLISALGKWVVEAVCLQLTEWRQRGIPLVPVAVNISARQMNDMHLVRELCDAVDHYELAPELLKLEITESCFMNHPERVVRILEILAKKGFSIEIDDYGTGFSSLGYIKMFPVHTIKIDRTFIKNIRNDTGDLEIVASTIALGHKLGLSIIAEGVETREQMIHLKTAGCDDIQGYYFHRPASASDIEPILIRGDFKHDGMAH